MVSGNDKTDERKEDGKGEENKQARELRDLAKEVTHWNLIGELQMNCRYGKTPTRNFNPERESWRVRTREEMGRTMWSRNNSANRTPNPPPAFEEFIKKRQSETDLYRTVPPNLKPYYKQLAENILIN